MLLTLFAACVTGGPADTDDTDVADGVAWYGDVEPIVTESCTSCHVEGGAGGFALDSFATAAPMAEAIAAAVESGRMPPWKAEPGCTEYRDDPSLSAAEIARLRQWADAGAPEGDVSHSVKVAPPDSTLDRVDFTVPMKEAYAPDLTGTDDYRCFLLDWPAEDNTYVTGYRIAPGNAAVVHHVIAFIAPPSQMEEYAALDEAEPGSGWTCFGGPGLADQQDAEWLGAWAPGGGDGAFPNGTGIKMKAGSGVVLQVHYNTALGDAGDDLTSVEFMTADDVETAATIQPWTDASWLDGTGMDIPAGATGVEHGFDLVNNFDTDITIHTSSLHMHQMGRTARLEMSEGNQTDCMLDIADWDFNWQRTYVFAEKKVWEPGETLSLSCTWDNPTDKDANWGEGTGDEMCLGTMLWSY